MKYDFGKSVDRYGTNSLKYDFSRERGMPDGILPLWVADMDFKVAPCITKALQQRVDHGIYGYSDIKDDYFEALRQWFDTRFSWKLERPWLFMTPGVVCAVYMAVRALTNPGDSVIIMEPVYYPFRSAVTDTGRELVVTELIYSDGFYEIDFDDFERKITDSKVRMFILCSPHNPVGRVWTITELERIADICLRHGVTVVSDEIHQDFVYTPHNHTVFASISGEISDITVTCTSPSKSFNIAGLNTSNIFISNKILHARLAAEYKSSGLSQPGVMGITAGKAAYSQGGEWLDELKAYIRGNFDFVRSFLREHIPNTALVEPEGTYLAWLDCRQAEPNPERLNSRIVKDAGLWLDDGRMFGASGGGFQRINIAVSRATIEQALYRLKGIF